MAHSVSDIPAEIDGRYADVLMVVSADGTGPIAAKSPKAPWPNWCRPASVDQPGSGIRGGGEWQAKIRIMPWWLTLVEGTE
jgi:hypothetical protein